MYEATLAGAAVYILIGLCIFILVSLNEYSYSAPMNESILGGCVVGIIWPVTLPVYLYFYSSVVKRIVNIPLYILFYGCRRK